MEPDEHQPTNSVQVTGRVSGAPAQRQLPSGDVLVTFRVVVPRSAAVRRRTKQSVDTFECSAWTARMRRAAARLVDGEEVTLRGELRRSFRRAGAGVTSWVTVDVDTITRLPRHADAS